jgi:thioredoxin-dependent peroxiredoxin
MRATTDWLDRGSWRRAGGALLLACACACSDASTPAGNVAASTSPPVEPGVRYKDIPVSTASAGTGADATADSGITLRGQSLALLGSGIAVGQTLRAAALTTADNTLLDLAEKPGRVRVISVVPSLDTPVCEQQTHYLSERSGSLAADVQLVTVSVDTPFAQARFARDARIKNITFLSDYDNHEFGLAHGLLVDKPAVLARAMMVVDRDNVIRYLQVTPEVASMPDMEAALAFARQLVQESKGAPGPS